MEQTQPESLAPSQREPAPRTLGSTRNATVAIPAASMPRELVYLASDLPDERRAALGELAPNVRIISGLTQASVMEHAATAHGADAHLCTPEFLQAATELRWVQAWSAGVDRYLGLRELIDRDEVVFTNMKGMHGPVIAEHVFAMLLSRTRNLRFYHEAMREGRWARGGSEAMSALYGNTMLVVGLGGIGSEVARRAHAFGMRVVATARTKREAPAYVDALGTAEDLDALLPQADVVVLAVPLTAETRGMIERKRLALMKDGSYLINIARGAVVDTDALIHALDAGKLAGALLDVTDPEPLPPEHPLWRRPDVFITPHVSSRAEVTGERRWSLFRENLGRFARGEPLLNVVDKRAGY